MHPLVSSVRVADINFQKQDVWGQFSLDFYCISLKKGISAKVKYGQQYYDFDKGLKTFITPKQVQIIDEPHIDVLKPEYGMGKVLLFHPNFFVQTCLPLPI